MTGTYFKYTLGFIECEDSGTVLLLNREKPPHMGKWNGVGGKLDKGETPLECIIRETIEETELTISNYKDRGVLRWFNNGEDLGGVHLFTGTVPFEVYSNYKCKSTREGILEFKKKEWVLHPENVGVVDNIKIIYNDMSKGDKNSRFVAEYADMRLLRAYQTE